MKRIVYEVTIFISFFLITVALVLPLFYEWLLRSRDYEYMVYFLCSGIVIILYGMTQKRIRMNWFKSVLAFITSLFLTTGIMLYNNLLRYLNMRTIFADCVYTYASEIASDIRYSGGLGIFRYILYATAILSICLAIAVIDNLITTKKLAKALWQMRTKWLFYRIKKTGKMPAPFIILDTPSGYGKTRFVKTICSLFPSNQIKLMSSEEFENAFFTYIMSRNSMTEDIAMTDAFKETKIVVIEDIDIFLSGRENTQEEVARIFLNAIKNEVSIVITGINIIERAPFFYWKMRCMNSKSETLVISK